MAELAKPIRAVLFDYGGVVCFHPEDQQFADAARDSGLAPEDFILAFWLHRIPYDAGRLTPEEYWREVLTSTGGEFDPARVPIMIQHEISFWLRIDQRILDWSDQLRAQGIRTGILSNMPPPLGLHLRDHAGCLEHFDHTTFSFETNGVKPAPEIYHHSLAGIGTSAGETLFLDDRPENVAGAREVGMHAELFETWEGFLATGLPRYALPAPAMARRQ